jgi:hypothetical protein
MPWGARLHSAGVERQRACDRCDTCGGIPVDGATAPPLEIMAKNTPIKALLEEMAKDATD